MFDGAYSREEMEALKKEIFSSLHCAMPGKVMIWYPGSNTADIQPMIKTKSGISLPRLKNVPVFMPLLNNSPAFDVEEGQYCLVIFADSAVENWLLTGSESVPVSDRQHDLSDAFAFVGFYPGGGE